MELFSANVDFHGDLVRNIPGLRRSAHLFDDLSDDPADWEVAIASEGTQRIPTAAASGAAHYLKMFGIVTGGFLMAKGAMAAQEGQADPSADQRFLDAKLITARFFADQFLPQAVGLLTPITEGHLTVTALSDDQF